MTIKLYLILLTSINLELLEAYIVVGAIIY